MTATPGEKTDSFTLTFSGHYLNGEEVTGSGVANVYTGYEWRASLKINDIPSRQVLAANADGKQMSGRQFERDHDERGLRLSATKVQDQAQIIALQPSFLRSGQEQVIKIIGIGLDGKVDLGNGIEILEEVSRTADLIVVRAKASASDGNRTVTVGSSQLNAALNVYQQVDRIEIQPAYAIARVGDNGGPLPKVNAMFDAIAWTAGADGETDTEDDVRLGRVNASWRVAPFDAKAEEDRDVD